MSAKKDLRKFLPLDSDKEQQENKKKKSPPEGRDGDESRRLGDERIAEGELTEAIRHYKKAISQDSENTENRLRLADAYQFAEQGPKAAAQYEKLLRKVDRPEGHVGLAEVYRRYGKHRAGILRLEKACRMNPNNAYYWFRLAEAFVAAGAPKDAVNPATRAAMAEPNDAFYHIWLGNLLMNLGQTAGAISALKNAIHLSPGEDDLHAKLAALHCAEEAMKEAKRAIQMACDLDPASNLYKAMQADIHRKMNETSPSPEPLLDSYDSDALRKWRAIAKI